MKAGFRFRTILGLTAFFVLLASAWGVNAPQPASHTPSNEMTVQPEPKPREIAIRSLSAYRIKPAEILQIELLKMVPLPPYRVAAYDVLTIIVSGTLADQPIRNYFLIGAEGKVNLGAAYGKVHIVGMTIPEVEAAIERHLRKYVRQPEASVEIARASGVGADHRKQCCRPGRNGRITGNTARFMWQA